jgi:hypothetical protein
MLLNIRQLMDDAKCYEVVRELRWPDGLKCPACDSGQTFGKRGFHDHQAHRHMSLFSLPSSIKALLPRY